LEYEEGKWLELTESLIKNTRHSKASIIYVAEETGWGIVPSDEITRRFRDRLGKLTRQIALIADPVYLVAAGYLLNLRQLAIPLPE
jgi:adenosylcobinamide kinase/adenosylcobinamide-phosphate guanylyltransferase